MTTTQDYGFDALLRHGSRSHAWPTTVDALHRQPLSPTLILAHRLPEMDGYEVARHIRQKPGAWKRMLCAITGYGQVPPNKQRSKEAGFDQTMSKTDRSADLNELLPNPIPQKRKPACEWLLKVP